MVRVAPFRALRYGPRDDLRRVTTPPHDVITPLQLERARGEANSIAHLVLPEGESRFEAAANRLADWVARGVLVRDDRPAVYRYEVEHGPVHARRRMRGFFARIGLDPTRKDVRPHENTLARKRGDRQQIRAATACDLEPIWLLYRDPEAHVDSLLLRTPARLVADFVDGEGSRHRMHAVQDPATLDAVKASFESRSLVIADGHHRYQSALDHWAATGRREHASILACLARDDDEGISVEPTHRLVAWSGTWRKALQACERDWDLRPMDVSGDQATVASRLEASLAPGRAVLVGRDGGLQAVLATRRKEPEGELAVAMVQEGLLRAALGRDESDLRFERDAAVAMQAVADGSCGLAVLVPPERVQSVLDTASAGRLMPAKATYFVPKPPSGLVLAPLDE
jgi:uncharacterized protein (DUF1015 family)